MKKNCHMVNEGMREFLREFEIEHSDINDICYVQGDQWYIQGHETCIGAYPEVMKFFVCKFFFGLINLSHAIFYLQKFPLRQKFLAKRIFRGRQKFLTHKKTFFLC